MPLFRGGPIPHEGFLRQATPRDVRALARIIVDCSNADPAYPYRFPFIHSHLEAYIRYCEEKSLEYVNTCTVMVYEIPNRRPHKRNKVIAFSVWKDPSPPVPHPARRLSNSHAQVSARVPPDTISRPTQAPPPYARPDRVLAFREESRRAKSNILDARYAQGHMFLKILLCHSRYRGRGAGTALTQWGMNKARAQGLNTTLFASPMGQELYKKLGFKVVDRFRVQLENETEALDIPAMVYECPGVQRKASLSNNNTLAVPVLTAAKSW